jgi:hypothetical protein
MGNGKAIGSSERLLLLLRALSPEALRALLAELDGKPLGGREAPTPAPGPLRGDRPRRRTP